MECTLGRSVKSSSIFNSRNDEGQHIQSVRSCKKRRTLIVHPQKCGHVIGISVIPDLPSHCLQYIRVDPDAFPDAFGCDDRHDAARPSHSPEVKNPSQTYSRMQRLILPTEMASVNSPDQTWCTKCSTFRNSEDFKTNKSGQKMKQCERHKKKRELAQCFDDWDTFGAQLQAWNHPVCYCYTPQPVLILTFHRLNPIALMSSACSIWITCQLHLHLSYLNKTMVLLTRLR